MINLLPPEYRQRLKDEEYFRLVLISGALLLLFFVSLSLMLLSIRIYLSGEIDAQKILVERQQEEYNRENPLELNVKDLNRSVAQLAAFYKEQILLSAILQEVTAALPSEAYLTSFVYNSGAPGKISLAGFAPTSEDLQAFRGTLEQNSRFSNFFFPLSNSTSERDITFSFTFTVQ